MFIILIKKELKQTKSIRKTETIITKNRTRKKIIIIHRGQEIPILIDLMMGVEQGIDKIYLRNDKGRMFPLVVGEQIFSKRRKNKKMISFLRYARIITILS